MPKRTREQKIKALDKRLKHLSPVIDTTAVSAEPVGHTPTFSIKQAFSSTAPSQPSSTVRPTRALEDISYISHDIQRITIVTIALLACEFLLYWLIQSHIVRFW